MQNKLNADCDIIAVIISIRNMFGMDQKTTQNDGVNIDPNTASVSADLAVKSPIKKLKFKTILLAIVLVLLSGTGTVGTLSYFKQLATSKDNAASLNNVDNTTSDVVGQLTSLQSKSISAGYGHTCTVSTDNKVYCWGYGYPGYVSDYSASGQSKMDNPTPISLPAELADKKIDTIVAGGSGTCLTTSDHRLYCWSGSSPYESVNDSKSPMNSEGVAKVSVGFEHSCAVTLKGNAYCWGQNSQGQFGNGDKNGEVIPTMPDMSGVLNGKTFKSISAGQWHTCAIASDDQAYCWGNNVDGELGNNTESTSSVYNPVAVYTGGVLKGKTLKSISTGFNNSCALASDNQVYCWGSRKGFPDYLPHSQAYAIDTSALGGKTVKLLSAGEGYVCIVASDDHVYCWGYLEETVVSEGGYSPIKSAPAAITQNGFADKKIKQVTAGEHQGCAIDFDDNTYCWGKYYTEEQTTSKNIDKYTIPFEVKL
jgi:alpha-tubulin suppressor-like RCC1 family protein